MAEDANPPQHITVAIATARRPQYLEATVGAFLAQSRRPDAIVICASAPEDLGTLDPNAPGIELLLGARGSCTQRNRIIEHASASDIILFCDDDFLPRFDYVEQMAAVFDACPDVVMTTGRVLVDGVIGPGLSLDQARAILAQDVADPEAAAIEDVYAGYGCNMAVRMAPVRDARIRFDENLPLYGWLEDVDFSRQLVQLGRIVGCSAARGVHLGVKAGRPPGIRLGYSQVANPIYLIRKGTCSPRRALWLMGRNIASNVVGCIRPEPFIDRVGRARGNLRALLDLLRGRLSPLRVLTL